MAEEQVMAVALGVRRNLDDVLGYAHLPEVMAECYRRVVDSRLRASGV